ncbi:thiol-disulfide isomerase [Lysinibacillus sp. BF-4]|uniref:Glutaredoxin n=1 Tax=Metalysinibacillus saudimassiliensis TaxID=1461583 RepID=A0A078MDF4_9BACL|nr:glutaredoxin family protein [Lysinibacillus sp. BF-4]KFL42588.1 thiol-disulfide isomerase [Lysinibacillus sp. BF-4]CEA04295.1 hypothetical protein BN1050_01925 [Metalysinibacillus saudimassiliensis]
MELTFYGRPNCALCDEGKRVLALAIEGTAVTINYINIEDDDFLHEKYMVMIPVVTKGEEVIQYGQLDYVTLVEAISS